MKSFKNKIALVTGSSKGVGKAEASIGAEATDEYAVMIDTFHPMYVTEEAMRLDDPSYPYSWLGDNKS